jgi:hypothetical protein
MYKIVSSKTIVSFFNSSKYFKKSLGKIYLGNVKNEMKLDLSKQEDFVKFYYEKSNGSKIFKEGNIGQIEFYTDFNIKNELIFFYEQWDFTFQFNKQILNDKGIEGYLGSIIKEIETNYIENLKKTQKEKEVVKELSPIEKIEMAKQKLKTNPGMITYDDVKEILKSKKRFNT